MYITGYRFRKTLLGRIVLQVKIGNMFLDATRNDYMYMLTHRKDWLDIITEMVDTSSEYATGTIALRYSPTMRKVYLLIEEYDSTLTQYPIEFVNASEKYVVPEYLV